MGTKHGPKNSDFDSDSYDDYDDFEEELDDDLGNIKNLSKDFYSADWEDPSESDYRFNKRRSDRKKSNKDLYQDSDDGDDLDFGNEW